MKILLAGATGVIGRLLLPMLIEAGHEVAGTTRSADKSGQISDAGGRPVVLDVLDREMTFAVLEAEQPDLIMHQLTDLATFDFAGNSRLRIAGTRNLVDAAKAVGVQHMIAQSISWICVPGEGLSREEDALDLDAPDPRGRTVAAVQALEQAVSEMPVGVILRYGLLYGPGTWYDREGWITDQMKKGEMEATDAVSSFVHVADAAKAARLALNWSSGVYNVVDDEPAAGVEWMPVYASLVGAPAPRIKPGREAWERGASNAKAYQAGWQPQYPTWRDGFKTVLTQDQGSGS